MYCKRSGKKLKFSNHPKGNVSTREVKLLHQDHQTLPSTSFSQLTRNDSVSPNIKNPARPDVRKLAAKLVTVACKDERALRLLT